MTAKNYMRKMDKSLKGEAIITEKVGDGMWMTLLNNG